MGLRLRVGVNVAVNIGWRRWGVGEVSALVDGVRVDTEAVGSGGGRVASRETSGVWLWRREGRTVMSAAAAATARGDASGGTGMPFRTLGKNPCARAVMDVSACGKGNRSGFDMWRRSGKGKEEVRTGVRMLPRARRRPCAWASRWASCSIEGMERCGRGRFATGGVKGVRGEDERMEWDDGSARW